MAFLAGQTWVTQETCDLWHNWSEWWGDKTWPTKRHWQRQRPWQRQRLLESTSKEQSQILMTFEKLIKVMRRHDLTIKKTKTKTYFLFTSLKLVNRNRISKEYIQNTYQIWKLTDQNTENIASPRCTATPHAPRSLTLCTVEMPWWHNFVNIQCNPMIKFICRLYYYQ